MSLFKNNLIKLFFGIALLGLFPGTVSVWADASPNGCLHSDGQAAGCSAASTPEPSSLAMLTVGLIGVAALGFFGRKKFANQSK